MTQEEIELMDSRMTYRINRQEREKERQKKKHQMKIESVDWFSIINEQGGDNNGTDETDI